MKISAGLLGNGQMPGSELDITYLLVALHLVVAKRVTLSIDDLFKRRDNKEGAELAG